MTTLTIMRGISGSGKSTTARRIQDLSSAPTIVVSRDDLRLGLYNTDFGGGIDEDFITSVEDTIINKALSRGIYVISDNTNLIPRFVQNRVERARTMGATVVLQEVEVPLALAKDRNRQRGASGGRFVPEDVIDKQHENFYAHQERIAQIFE